MSNESVIVIGGGIAGLTSAALLAREGIAVTLLESHSQTGGCAGTFSRGRFIFDAGATQVAGLEVGGSHERIFRHLNIPLPKAHVLDPACVVDLDDGYEPIRIWHDPIKWEKERKKHFPDSDSFWNLIAHIHRSNWDFSKRDPILPVRDSWDFIQLIKAIRPANLGFGILSRLSIADLLMLCGSKNDLRLKRFLDLQLKLYSQENADRTAALYGATVLNIAQAPLGLWHLDGSMKKLSDKLEDSVKRSGGRIYLRHRVMHIERQLRGRSWKVDILRSPGKKPIYMHASDIICTLPPQCLPELLVKDINHNKAYIEYIKTLAKPKGALVFYGAIRRSCLPDECFGHIQFPLQDPGDLFISISDEGDGRAPEGFATVIASSFTDVSAWSNLTDEIYRQRKQIVLARILGAMEDRLQISSANWEHQELATPRSFAKWTGRPEGIVGGLGQTPSKFGPFGLASRTPIPGLWLCGDSIYPGEGTAGVTQSAVMASRQLLENRGKEFTMFL
ncbi:C-3',4' desaturase CrtD [Prochlorococcus sp. MIT 1341]|uniref:C-3',4' desaturase CrtD n=1 Tax=Prochlorococcus sp. MIT 1341 TaxID=3096221 RepID=UPI002A760601|nr:C-3',4' desaturase CrtD [Prochlorococcus sp. MIT 1341]